MTVRKSRSNRRRSRYACISIVISCPSQVSANICKMQNENKAEKQHFEIFIVFQNGGKVLCIGRRCNLLYELFYHF